MRRSLFCLFWFYQRGCEIAEGLDHFPVPDDKVNGRCILFGDYDSLIPDHHETEVPEDRLGLPFQMQVRVIFRQFLQGFGMGQELFVSIGNRTGPSLTSV